VIYLAPGIVLSLRDQQLLAKLAITTCTLQFEPGWAKAFRSMKSMQALNNQRAIVSQVPLQCR